MEQSILPSNSLIKSEQKAPERKTPEPLVSGKSRKKKKTIKERFVSTFINGDPTDLKSRVFYDILVPLIKKSIDDSVHILLYGKKSNSGPPINGEITSYNRMASGRTYVIGPTEIAQKRQRNSTRTFCDISFDDWGDALRVKENIESSIKTFGNVTVQEVFTWSGLKSDWTDCNYGWTSLYGIELISGDDGAVLKLPPAIQLPNPFD